MNHNQGRLTYPHSTGCGCRACCIVEATHEAIGESVDERIAAMSFTELRGLSYDYKDLIQGKPHDPGSFKDWLRDRVADQLIAKQYNDEKEWF